jgi:hypothetical protein
MKMSQEKLTKLIRKMTNVIKPKGVLDIEFHLEPLGIRDDEYYMNITYIVPDDSEYLRSSNMRFSDNKRINWNSEIKNSIKGYFNVDVIINSTGIKSESYYNKQKEI